MKKLGGYVCDRCQRSVDFNTVKIEDWHHSAFNSGKGDLCPKCCAHETIKLIDRLISIYPKAYLWALFDKIGIKPGNINFSTNSAIYSMVKRNYQSLINKKHNDRI